MENDAKKADDAEKKESRIELIRHLATIIGVFLEGTLATIIGLIAANWTNVLTLTIGLLVGGVGVVVFSRATIDETHVLRGIQDGLRGFIATEDIRKVENEWQRLNDGWQRLNKSRKDFNTNREKRVRKLIEESQYALAVFKKIGNGADSMKIIGWLANPPGKGIFKLSPIKQSLGDRPIRNLLERLACQMLPKDTYAMNEDQARIMEAVGKGERALAEVPLLFSDDPSLSEQLRGKAFFPYVVYESPPWDAGNGQKGNDMFIMYVENKYYRANNNPIHTAYWEEYQNNYIKEKKKYKIQCDPDA